MKSTHTLERMQAGVYGRFWREQKKEENIN